MRVLHLVYGTRWTGPAAVASDQVRALRAGGVEAELGFAAVSGRPDARMEKYLGGCGWARPLLTKARLPQDFVRDVGRLRRLLEREQFEIVHCHHSHDLALAALARPRGRSVPIVATVHNRSLLRQGPVSRWILGRCAGLAFSNSKLEETWRSTHPARGAVPTAVLFPVVDRTRFAPGARDEALAGSLGLRSGETVALAIGKMAQGRGFDVVLGAFAAAGPGSRLLLVGKGEEEPALRELARSRGVAERVIWAGYRDDDLPALLRLADVFVFAAAGTDEGHRAILEAMSAGVPVAAIRVAGVEDLVRDGREGALAENEAALGSGLARLFSDRSRREELARGARERSAAFAAEPFAARAGAFYREVLAADGG